MTKHLAVACLALLFALGCGGRSEEAANGNTGGSAGGAGAGGAGGSAGVGGSGGSAGIGGSGGSAGIGGSGGSAGVGGSGGSAGIGGAGGAGGGETDGSAGSGGAPSECAGPAAGPGPYATTLRFRNPTGTPLWLADDCGLSWGLYTCAGGYQDAVPHEAPCTVACSDLDHGCMACGMCAPNAIEVTSATPAEVAWPGFTYAFEQQSNCTCHKEHEAPPGKYAVRVKVYASQSDAIDRTGGTEASAYFTLPVSGGVVEVTLGGGN